MKELEEQGIIQYTDGITNIAYGQYALLMHIASDVYLRLKKYFPIEMATQICCYALIMCTNKFVYMDQIDDYYQESYMSVLYQNFSFRMGYKALASLLHHPGSRGNPVREFEQSLIDESSKNVAIDVHVIRSCSENNDLTEPGYVTIPCPIIHKTDMIDDTHAKVYGSFWILNYVRRGETLFNISGGEYPAVIMLENADGRWQVTAMEEAGDGEDYVEDIERFADGDQELADQYFAGADLGAEANQAIRTQFIKAYVEANGLNITAYQDYGWEPVELN